MTLDSLSTMTFDQLAAGVSIIIDKDGTEQSAPGILGSDGVYHASGTLTAGTWSAAGGDESVFGMKSAFGFTNL